MEKKQRIRDWLTHICAHLIYNEVALKTTGFQKVVLDQMHKHVGKKTKVGPYLHVYKT